MNRTVSPGVVGSNPIDVTKPSFGGIETVFERSKVKERSGTQEPIFEILAASASEAWLMLEMRESVFFRLKRRVRNNRADPLKWQSRMSSAILGGTRKILAAGCVG